MGVEHGFNLVAAYRGGSERELYARKTAACQADIVEWLKRVAWSDKAT